MTDDNALVPTAAAATLSEADLATLRTAARQIAGGGSSVLARLSSLAGGVLGRAPRMLPDFVRDRLYAATEEALKLAYEVGTATLGTTPGKGARSWLSKIVATGSGAATGMAGIPGALLDVPFTTVLILRSVAEIARAHGEDIASPEGKRACLEVLALGTPGGEAREGSYWAVRAGLNRLTIDAMLRRTAAALSLVLSEKVLAQSVPVLGAVAGGGINYLFVSYYQAMAEAHFSVRAVERANPGVDVQACLDGMVLDIREHGGPGVGAALGRVASAVAAGR